MGIFTSIGSLFSPRIKNVQKSLRNLERQKAQQAVNSVARSKAFRAQEDPRELAHQKQAMFARGLGKSSIFDQDKARLEMIHTQRNAQLDEAEHFADSYAQYIRRKHSMEKVNKYMQVLDSIVSIAAGAGGGPSEGAPAFGDGGGAMGGAYSGSGGGSYYGGGGGGMGAAGGGYSGAYGGSYY